MNLAVYIKGPGYEDRAELRDDKAECSNGLPVLVLRGQALVPGDLLPSLKIEIAWRKARTGPVWAMVHFMARLDEGGIETRGILCQAGITSAKFHKWCELGLLPFWVSRRAIGGNGLRYKYPIETVELARKIKAWREKGISYNRIRQLLAGE